MRRRKKKPHNLISMGGKLFDVNKWTVAIISDDFFIVHSRFRQGNYLFIHNYLGPRFVTNASHMRLRGSGRLSQWADVHPYGAEDNRAIPKLVMPKTTEGTWLYYHNQTRKYITGALFFISFFSSLLQKLTSPSSSLSSRRDTLSLSRYRSHLLPFFGLRSRLISFFFAKVTFEYHVAIHGNAVRQIAFTQLVLF